MQNTEANYEDMATLSTVTTKSIQRGYTENFKVTEQGLYGATTDIYYLPNEVKIDNFYRFEGASDPQDNSILYLLETHDGVKGILIDSYGADADDFITDFIRDIPEVPKDKH